MKLSELTSKYLFDIEATKSAYQVAGVDTSVGNPNEMRFYLDYEELRELRGENDNRLKTTVEEFTPEVASDDKRKVIAQDRVGDSNAPPLSKTVEAHTKLYLRNIKDAHSKQVFQEMIKLASHGFHVFPVHSIDADGDCTCQYVSKTNAKTYKKAFVSDCLNGPGKHPKTRYGLKEATCNVETILLWFEEGRNRFGPTNIGIASGPDYGVLQIDIDGETGFASLDKLQEKWGPLPSTISVVTGSGGRHYYFRYPKHRDIRNSISALGWVGSKIDVRGENGYVVGPPSRHASGGSYCWIEGHSPDDLCLAELPPQWVEGCYLATKSHRDELEQNNTAVSVTAKPTKASKLNADKDGRPGERPPSFDDIGDHDGGGGFYNPIWRLMCQFFANLGADPIGDEEDAVEKFKGAVAEFKQQIITRVQRSAKDSDRCRARYESDDFLDLKLEEARQFIRENPPTARKAVPKIGKANLPYGFVIGESGEIGRFEKTDKGNRFVPICSMFEVRGEARTAAGNDWSLVIEFQDRDGRRKQHRISQKLLVSDSKLVRGELVDSGLRVNLTERNEFDRLLGAIVSDHRLLIAKSPGWQSDGIFVSPDGRAFGADENTEIILDNAMTDMVRGDLPGSIAVMNAALHSGVAHWALAPMFGVAGCLVDFLGIDSCSIALTGATSKGKTTALTIAASVWGNPDARGGNSMLTSLSGTSNSYETLLQRANGIGFFGDEMQHMDDGRALQQLVFSTAQGEGKGRLRPDGSERERRRWRTFAVLTGEIGVIQKINREGAKAAGGLNARIVDFDVSNAPDASAACLAALSGRSQHFGHIGLAFANWLRANGSPENMRCKIVDYASLIAGEKASVLEKRAGGVFAILRLAGEIMQSAGLIDAQFDISGLIRIVKSENTPESLNHVQRALETLRTTVEERWNQSIHPLVNLEADRFYTKADAWRDEDSPLTGLGRVFIPRDKLVELAGGAVKLNELVKALKDAPTPEHRLKGSGTWQGVLQMKGKNNLHEQLPETGGKVPHYRIDMSFFRGQELDDDKIEDFDS